MTFLVSGNIGADVYMCFNHGGPLNCNDYISVLLFCIYYFYTDMDLNKVELN